MQNRRSVLFGDIPHQPRVFPLFVVAKTIPHDAFLGSELVYAHPEDESAIVKAQLRNASDAWLNHIRLAWRPAFLLLAIVSSEFAYFHIERISLYRLLDRHGLRGE